MSKADADQPSRVVRVLWGWDEPQRRGPKPALTLDTIAAAAVKLADTEGLSAVSMNRVASQLGFTTMSLYRYVSSKDDLVALMLDHAAGERDLSGRRTRGWRAALERWSVDYRDVLHRHPWVTQVPVAGLPTTPNQVAWMESGLRTMSATGLSETEKLQVLLVVTSYVRSSAQLDGEIAQAQRAAGREPRTVMSRYAEILNRLIDDDRFPALRKSLASGAFEQDDDDPDEDFRFGLKTVLDGIAVLVRARAPKAARPA